MCGLFKETESETEMVDMMIYLDDESKSFSMTTTSFYYHSCNADCYHLFLSLLALMVEGVHSPNDSNAAIPPPLSRLKA